MNTRERTHRRVNHWNTLAALLILLVVAVFEIIGIFTVVRYILREPNVAMPPEATSTFLEEPLTTSLRPAASIHEKYLTHTLTLSTAFNVSELSSPEDSVVAAEVDSEAATYFRPEKLDEALFNLVIEECERESVPVVAALAIMKTECQTFNVNAKNVNKNGTYDSGIMQINSSNRTGFASRYNVPEFAENPMDPEANIKVGIRYFAENYRVYIEQYDGDEVKALLASAGAYNRGAYNQNKYHNIYSHMAITYFHWKNLSQGIDEDINYGDSTIPDTLEWLKSNFVL